MKPRERQEASPEVARGLVGVEPGWVRVTPPVDAIEHGARREVVDMVVMMLAIMRTALVVAREQTSAGSQGFARIQRLIHGSYWLEGVLRDVSA